jgi:hypothetical protein
MLGKAAAEHLGVTITGFRDSAQLIAAKRRQENVEKAREAKDAAAKLINDPRPKIELPGSNRLLSEFATELAPLLARHGFFAKDRVVVVPNESGNGLDPVTGRIFRTAIERHVVPYYAINGKNGATLSFDRTLAKEDSESSIVCPQFIERLPSITATNNARFPVTRNTGDIELLPEGYDRDSGILTLPGGPIVELWELEVASSVLRSLFAEFCFQEGDHERAMSVALSGMLTLFAFYLLPKGSQRPGFLYSANSEGSGKSLLAKLAMIPRIGSAPTGCDPEDEHELRKSIFASAIAASPIFFLDNVKKHLSSGSLEAAMTATHIKGRLLGQSREVEAYNSITFFITGNGCTISSDLRRRLLIVELFLREAMPEDRKIHHPLDHNGVLLIRGEILSALWSLTRAWADAGQPKPKTSHTSFPVWANIIGGIIEHAGFASPCTRAATDISGDRDTADMQRLVSAMAARGKKGDLKPKEMYELCRQIGAFPGLVGEDESDLGDGEKAANNRRVLGKIFKRFESRIFSDGHNSHTFRIYDGGSKNTKAYYVE